MSRTRQGGNGGDDMIVEGGGGVWVGMWVFNMNDLFCCTD